MRAWQLDWWNILLTILWKKIQKPKELFSFIRQQPVSKTHRKGLFTYNNPTYMHLTNLIEEKSKKGEQYFHMLR